MKKFGPDDIPILNDAVGHVRGNPFMYLNGQDKASGEWLAARLVSDMIVLGYFPTKVDRVGTWWVISASLDWLYGDDHHIDRLFNNINTLPEVANSCRGEILLTAFASAVVVCGRDGVRWLKGSPATMSLPAGIDDQCQHSAKASIVAFNM